MNPLLPLLSAFASKIPSDYHCKILPVQTSKQAIRPQLQLMIDPKILVFNPLKNPHKTLLST